MKVHAAQRLGGVVAALGLGLLTVGSLLHGGPIEIAVFGTLTGIFAVAVASDWHRSRQPIEAPAVRASGYGRVLILLMFAVGAVGLGIRSVLAVSASPA